MWRGPVTYFSTSTASSPKLLMRLALARRQRGLEVLAFSTARMPLPPPPALALISTG
jgi:hypothetical protein